MFLGKSSTYKKQMDLLLLESELISKHCEQLEQINCEHRKVLHNLHNYLSVIGILSETNCCHDITDLVREINAHLCGISDRIYCKNKVINALILDKLSLYQSSDIRFDIQITPDFDLYHISNFDIIAMLGNLFDNAFENASKSIEKNVCIKAAIVNNGKYSSIIIENSFPEKPRLCNGRFLTTKSKKSLHGIGLEHVKELTKKYGGILNIEFKDGIFCTSLFLPTSFSLLQCPSTVYN